MNLSSFSINRPVFTVMVALIVILVGAISVSRLPIDLIPEVEFPRLTVATSYENASPEEIEQLITRPVEEAVAAVPGVEEIFSNSLEGNSQVTLSFVWGTNLDEASNDVRDRLDRILNRLPQDADRPQLRKFDPNQFPVIILGASSRLDPIDLRTLLDNRIRNRLDRVPGVGAVDVWGGLEREIRVTVDPERIRALGISLESIVERIREENIVVPAGEIEEGRFQVALRTPGLLASLDELRDIVVARRDGAPVYLAQLAEVQDTHREVTRVTRINGEPGILLAIRKQSGTNTVQVVRDVRREVDRINADYAQLHLTSIRDTSEYIERSIANVTRSILYGGILAIVVLLFFLRSVRSTAIIATAIPISVIAAFSLMYFLGLTLNLMTLGGIALGVGMMVDNAIVVLENIFRLREKGSPPHKAAHQGSSEVAAAIVASTLTTMAIFLPLVFLEGVSGIMFRQLAYVISFTLLCSLIVALTLVPMLAARVPPATDAPRSGIAETGRGILTWAGAQFKRMEEGYRKLLDSAFRNRTACLGGAALLFAGTFALIPHLGTEFMPEADEGEVRVNAEMGEGTRIETMDAMMVRIERIVVENVPEIDNIEVRVGSSWWRPTSKARGDVRAYLVPLSQRTRSSEEIADDLREKLRDIAGVDIRTSPGRGLFLLRMATGGGDDADRLGVEITGFDLNTLDALTEQVSLAVEGVEGVTDVTISRQEGVPRQLVRIDRERAADFGLTTGRIARMLRTAIGGTLAGEFRDNGDEVRMLVRLRDADRMELTDVLDLTIPNENGEQIALRSLVTFDREPGPTQIERRNQQRVANVAVNFTDRDLGSASRDIMAAVSGIPLPPNYQIFVRGDYEEQQRAFRELMLSLVLSILLVYMVMACLYESLRNPLVVMFSVPLAAIGAIVMLFLTGSTLNVQSYIGLIMLGGIVVNNAILIVDQASRLQVAGASAEDAAREAGRRRLRPILMTSLTTILALTPLAAGLGEGAEAQAPLARAVIGGLISSAAITLFVIPIVYTLFNRNRQPETVPVEEAELAGN